ncbi:MAG: PhzF family phenazine biosynthesis protein [Actinomycetota bacterium]
MKVPFRLVDVFAERPLAGNQLCVVPENPGLDDTAMQGLASEIGFSETTFVTEASSDRYSMRIFTPGAELPFAGHPTLGTAFVLVSEGRVRSPATQVVKAGEFEVEADPTTNTARMRQLPPAFGPIASDLQEVAEAAGLSVRDLRPDLPPQVVSTGLPHLIVPAASVSAVKHAERNDGTLARLLRDVGAEGYYLFALSSGEAKARMFDTEFGIGEDPATGSAAGPLAAYLTAHRAGGMPGTIRIRQGEEIGRPSLLEANVVQVEDTLKVTVGGGVFVVGEGTFET